MRETRGQCPRCKQYRKLRSINYIDDRRQGIIISTDFRDVPYLCYNCLDEIDKGIKQGKKFTTLIGNGFNIAGYGLPKFLQEIRNKFRIEREILWKSYDFINVVYGRWIEIQSEDKLKYYFASVIMLLKKTNMGHIINTLEKHIKNHHTNVSIEEIYEKIKEIEVQCEERNFYPFFY